MCRKGSEIDLRDLRGEEKVVSEETEIDMSFWVKPCGLLP